MKNKTGVILLSGGLDSLVSLAAVKDVCDIKLALTFDYGQKALEDEIASSSEIAKVYGIEHKIVEVPFLKQITKNALTQDGELLEAEDLNIDSMKKVWVPNRNGLFLNIAACYADSFGFDYIIFGANKEEAETFSDNSKEFISRIEAELELSTLKQPKILAPMVEFEKFEIINYAIRNNVDLSLLKSCYDASVSKNKKHCGVCESCQRLKNGILKSVNKDLINLFF